MTPRPIDGDEAQPFRRRTTYVSNIARGDFFVIHHLQRFLHATLSEWVKPGVKLADIGCGEQPLRALVTSLGGIYTGVDVRQNRQNNVDVVADITDVPLPDSSFDVVLCTEVLEHVSDTRAAFSELTRLCNAGGAMVITTPFAYPLHEEPHDYIRLTPYQLRECARINHLEVVHLSTFGDELQVVATVWCNLWSRIGVDRLGIIRTAWNVMMRLPVNLCVYLFTPLLHSRLPRKIFLSTCCVMLKRG